VPARVSEATVQGIAPRDAPRKPPKRRAASYLGGAIGRLLPASIPFRYFGAAAVYHVFAWAALFVQVEDVPRFAGGLGWPLAALHLVTLGVLVMTAIGASMQLLPVATRQSLHSSRTAAAIWWVYTPGVAATSLGMGVASPTMLASGAALVAVALATYAVVLARNLFGAKGMPGVVAHGAVAWVSLAVLLVAALSLAFAYEGGRGLPRDVALALHVPFAAFGFIGMLALGLSYIVVPLFALSDPIDERIALASCAFAVVGLCAAAVSAFTLPGVAWRVGGVLAGAVAVALHLRLMRAALASGMRKDLGASFHFIRAGWVLLGASLVATLVVALRVPIGGTATFFGFVLIAGWLLTFLLGVLQRIVPFLASMHAARGRHLPPTPSALARGPALRIHYAGHFAALALLALAIATGEPWLVRAAAGAGFVGACAFAWFFATVVLRMAGAKPADQVQPVPA
jgi:hypothetical protein